MTAFDFADLVEHDDGTPGWKAEECLRRVGQLHPDDDAIRYYLAAAQVYATLELASKLESARTGDGLADVVERAGGR